MAKPPCPKQPAASPRHGGRVEGARELALPPREPTAGRGRIDAPERGLECSPCLLCMLAGVAQHVGDGVPRLARGAEHVAVIAVCEHAPGSPERAMNGPREPRADRLHPACEVSGGLRLDDQVDVIVLHGVVRDAKAPAVAGLTQRPLEASHESSAAKRRNPAANAQRHVDRVRPREGFVASMRVARVATALASRARPASAPFEDGAKGEFELTRSARHQVHFRMLCVGSNHNSDLNCAMYGAETSATSERSSEPSSNWHGGRPRR